MSEGVTPQQSQKVLHKVSAPPEEATYMPDLECLD